MMFFQIKLCFWRANPTGYFVSPEVRLHGSKDNDSLWIICVFCADVLHPAFPVVAQIVEAEAVVFLIDQLQQPIFHFQKCRVVQICFKNRVLYALGMILALLCNLSQPGSAGSINGAHVVTDYHHHRNAPFRRPSSESIG